MGSARSGSSAELLSSYGSTTQMFAHTVSPRVFIAQTIERVAMSAIRSIE